MATTTSATTTNKTSRSLSPPASPPKRQEEKQELILTPDTFPHELHQHLGSYLTEYESIARLGTCAKWLRALHLPFVTEVGLVIPVLETIGEIAATQGEDAAYDEFPENENEWRTWVQAEGAKLATGLLARLPNLQRIRGAMWNTAFQAMLGEAFCLLPPQRSLTDFVPTDSHTIFTNGAVRLFWTCIWQPYQDDYDKISPLVTAIGTGKLPSLKNIDFAQNELFFPGEEGRHAERNQHFSQAAWLALAQAIADGHLLELIELHVVMEMDNDKSAQFLQALNNAYLRRLTLEDGEEGVPRQAKMQVFDIQGVEDDDTVSPVLLTKLLNLPYFSDLQQLHLHCIGADQNNLFCVFVDNISSPFALEHKRPHLQELSIPSMLYVPQPDGGFLDPFVDALATHQVAANLHSLKFLCTLDGMLADLATIYSGGGFQHLRRLNIGQCMVDEVDELCALLRAALGSPSRGAALLELRGDLRYFAGDKYDEDDNDSWGLRFASYLRKGAFPAPQVISLMNLYRSSTTAHVLLFAIMSRPVNNLDTQGRITSIDSPTPLVSEYVASLSEDLSGNPGAIKTSLEMKKYIDQWCLP